MKLKVAQPYRLVHAGTVYTGGDTVDIDDADTAAQWIAQGWATETKPTPPRKKPG
jgi:hypothetical protein